MLVFWLKIIFFVGCGSETVSDSAYSNDTNTIIDSGTSNSEENEEPVVLGEIPISGERSIQHESLLAASTKAHSLNGFSSLIEHDGMAFYRDETQEEMISLGTYATMDGIALDTNRSLLLLDGEIVIFDGQWREDSPLSETMPIPAEHVFGQSDSLWLQGAGRLFLFQNGVLRNSGHAAEVSGFALGLVAWCS